MALPSSCRVRLTSRLLAVAAILTVVHGSAEAADDVHRAFAPDYEARELGRDSRANLASLRGKVVLLNAWATWCAPCLQELPAFGRADQLHRAAGLAVVAVNIDEGTSDERVRQYVRGLKLRFSIWRDPANRFARTFGAHGVPVTLLVDRTGRIVKHWTGPMDPTGADTAQLIAATLAERTAVDGAGNPGP